MINMRYPDGKAKALTLSYDDGVEQDITLLRLMEKHGVKGTFNINSGLFTEEGTVFPKGHVHRRLTKSAALELYKSDYCEVACHGYTHPFFHRMNPESCLWDVINDRKCLEDMFKKPIKGMAYPYGSTSDSVVENLKAAGIKYSRTTKSTLNFSIPTDWLRLPATCHHKAPELMELAEKFVNAKIESYQEPYFFYVWGHSYEFEHDDNWNVIEEFLGYISGKDDVWYATNVELYDYIQAYRNLELTLDETVAYNPSALDVWITKKGKTIKIAAGETVNI